MTDNSRVRSGATTSFAKRLVDVVGALSLLILTAPVVGILAVIGRLHFGAPVVFRQVRTGLGGRDFTLLKLRSMHELQDASGIPAPDAVRLDTYGRWLRATSADELPSLWNVLRGDMSLVGPRPLLPAYLPRYSPEQARRHAVRPGITGWAQIHGRNAVDWPIRLALDVWYVDHWSLGLDLRILVRTVGVVVLRRGISREGHATMPELEG